MLGLYRLTTGIGIVDVKFEINDGIALIALDDGKKNAITLAAGEAILEALREADASADAIVLAGRPGTE